MAEWTFLTHHAHVLLAVAADNDATVRGIAAEVGISQRRAVTLLNDLEASGYIERHRHGRRTHYLVRPERPLRHPTNAGRTVAELIAALSALR